MAAARHCGARRDEEAKGRDDGTVVSSAPRTPRYLAAMQPICHLRRTHGRSHARLGEARMGARGLVAGGLLASTSVVLLLFLLVASPSAFSLTHARPDPFTEAGHPLAAAEYTWLLVARVHAASEAVLPMAEVTVLQHARLQVCRPMHPHDPRLWPPSMRLGASGDTDGDGGSSSYPQNECLVFWRENWLQRTSNVGEAAIAFTVPSGILDRRATLAVRAQLGASSIRLRCQLRSQCHAWTAGDQVWMAMNDFDPESDLVNDDPVEREWDPQGLVAISVNPPQLPRHLPQLETRQLLWPFDPAGQRGCGAWLTQLCWLKLIVIGAQSSLACLLAHCFDIILVVVHEVGVLLLPLDARSPVIQPRPHPFTPQPTLPQVLFEEPAWHESTLMAHWWSVLWVLPLSLLAAVGLLRLVPLIRNRAELHAFLRACHPTREVVPALIQRCKDAWCLVQDLTFVMVEFSRYMVELIDWRATVSWPIDVTSSASALMTSVRCFTASWLLSIKECALDFLRPFVLDVFLPMYYRADARLEFLCCEYLFPLVDRVLEWVPSRVRSGYLCVESDFVWLLSFITHCRAAHLTSEVYRTIVTSFFELPPSSPPPSPAPSRRHPSSLNPALVRRRVEVGRGSPFLRGDAQLLDEQAGLQHFQALVDGQASPTPSSPTTLPDSPHHRATSVQASHRNVASSSSVGEHVDPAFESAAWREFEAGRRAARRARQLQREQEDKELAEAREDEADQRADEDDESDSSSHASATLSMPVWKEEEDKREQQHALISPVAYAFSGGSDDWLRARW